MKIAIKVVFSCILIVIFVFSSAGCVAVLDQADNSGKQKVLLLHSYNPELKWVKNINEGIKEVFAERKNLEIYEEYMDVKRNPGPEYIEKLTDLYRTKFRGKHFDVILTCDDDAYDFLKVHHQDMFTDTPVVFCGVNYLDEVDMRQLPLFTGVEEGIDIEHTLEVALHNHPQATQVVVINDDSNVGQANKKIMLKTMPKFTSKVNFIFLEHLSMAQVLRKIELLGKESIILLLSFNQDSEKETFLNEESLDMIANHAAVPIYGVWDVYLEHGIVGGMITNGYAQGEYAARIAMRILGGELPQNIPIVKNQNTNQYIFDYKQLIRYSISEDGLPVSSKVVNKPISFYEKHRSIVCLTTFAFFILFTVIIILVRNNRHKKRLTCELNAKASTDGMTGTLNRLAGMEFLRKQMIEADKKQTEFSVCFIDVNDLKIINDTYGHLNGDRAIRFIGQVLKESVRESDVVCRYGGDEFLLILPTCNRATAMSVGRCIEQRIEYCNRQQKYCVSITISLGIAEYSPGKSISAEALIQEADQEMYKNKTYFKKNKTVYCYNNL